MLLQRCAPAAARPRICCESAPKGNASQSAVMQTPNAVGRFVFLCAFPPPAQFVSLSREQTAITAIQPQDAFLWRRSCTGERGSRTYERTLETHVRYSSSR